MVNRLIRISFCLCALSFLAGCGGSKGPTTRVDTLAITSPAPPDGTTGTTYGGTQGFSFAADGGALPYTWSWTAAAGSSLPPGLDLTPDTGKVSGTTTAAGVYSFTIKISDSSSPPNQISLSFTITVISSTPLAITSPDPPDGILGAPYGGDSGYSLSAVGGVAPYTWTWVAANGSSLPPDLSLSSTGIISGTTTTASSYSFNITVSDSELMPAQSTSTYTIAVNPAAGLTITSGTPPSGRVGVHYGGFHYVQGHQFFGFELGATGGTPPYTWSWSAESGSSLPPGLSVGVLFFGGGSTRCCLSIPVIAGTPTQAGTYDVTVKVTDSASPPNHVSAKYTIDIQP
jgi:hypothetical protein